MFHTLISAILDCILNALFLITMYRPTNINYPIVSGSKYLFGITTLHKFEMTSLNDCPKSVLH